MPAYAVIGGQWGDEGKGKVVDFLASNAQVVDPRIKSKRPAAMNIVVRFNGGNNAGHTIWNENGEFALHLLPCGVVVPEVEMSVIGPEVMVNPLTIDNEDIHNPGEFQTIEKLCGITLENLRKRLIISKKAQLVFPWHIAQDILEEALRGGMGIGTTKRGIGPAVADKYSRFGMRVDNLLDAKNFGQLYAMLTKAWNAKVALFKGYYLPEIEKRLKAIEGITPEEVTKRYNRVIGEVNRAMGELPNIAKRVFSFREKFGPCFENVEEMLCAANEQGKNILFEGAQGFLLDINHGTYQYVTSSSCGLAAAVNCGITRFQEVIGVLKAYCTRVGGGPFPSEMLGEDEEIAALIRDTANEYGTVTRRPRRIGWFDFPAARYFARLNGVTRIALTRLDIFDAVAKIKVGVGYTCAHSNLGGDKQNPMVRDLYYSDFTHSNENGEVKAALEARYAWGPLPWGVSGARGCTRYEDLPEKARKYCEEIQDKVAPLLLVSTGPKRKETIVMAGK